MRRADPGGIGERLPGKPSPGFAQIEDTQAAAVYKHAVVTDQ